MPGHFQIRAVLEHEGGGRRVGEEGEGERGLIQGGEVGGGEGAGLNPPMYHLE